MKIKHESESGSKYFQSLFEQKEMFIQSIRTQQHREVFVLPPDSDKVISLRTLDVPAPNVEQDELERIKAYLLAQDSQRVEDTQTVHSISDGGGEELALGRELHATP